MYSLIFALVALILGLILPLFSPHLVKYRVASAIAGGLIAIAALATTSFYQVGPGQVGHLNRLYFGVPLAEGQLIAGHGQNGPQAETLGPGVHFRPFLRLLYEVEEFPLVSIPNGQYGLLTAKDGAPLQPGQFLAAAWPEDHLSDMLKADYFLHHGGQKGTQLTVLQPGQYRLNHYLFDVSLQSALDVEAGTVAVVKSNVQEAAQCADPTADQADEADMFAAALTSRGCMGVWDEPLLPGRYYLNRMAYQVVVIPTRAQSLVYSGGYTQRKINLTLDERDQIIEQTNQLEIPSPQQATDEAIVVTVEGWQVPLEVQTVLQIDPAQAPQLVATVGDVSALEETLLTPVLRNLVRDAAEATGRTVFDLISRRAELETQVEQAMQAYGRTIGVSILSVRFGQPAIPPELLAVQQRHNLARQLQQTYQEEETAQTQRIEVEKAKAMADQQPDLVQAELAVEIAELNKQATQKQGEGEKLRLAEIAEVLGHEEALQLTMLQAILAAAKENPDMVKVPMVLVQGEGSGLVGSAAVLGAGNLLEWISHQPLDALTQTAPGQ